MQKKTERALHQLKYMISYVTSLMLSLPAVSVELLLSLFSQLTIRICCLRKLVTGGKLTHREVVQITVWLSCAIALIAIHFWIFGKESRQVDQESQDSTSPTTKIGEPILAAK